MSDIKDIGSIFGVLEDLENVKLAEEQMAIKQQQFNEAQKLKFEAAEKTRNYNLTKENLNDRREENEVEIARLVQEIGNWNIVAQDWSNIDDKYGKGKTEDGKALLEELGLVYGENFKFKEAASLDYAEQLNNTQNLITLQEEIINDLTSKQNEILRLHDDWAKVGLDSGLKGIKDTDDIKAYIEENPERFLNENKELNELATAFMKTKDTPGDPYGFAMTTPTDAMLKAAGLSTKEGTRGIPTADLDKQELDFNMNANFALLKESLSKVKTKDGNNNWAEDLGLSGLGNLEGASKLWDDERSALLLKDNMERKIIDMMKKSTDYSWVSNLLGGKQASSGAKIREDYKLDDLENNPALREAVVNKIFEDYAGDEKVINRNIEGEEIGFEMRKREKSEGGLLNKKFSNDKIFFTQRSGGDYGNAPEDEVFYYLLKSWKPLQTALGNTQ